jgi:hypothetical protein
MPSSELNHECIGDTVSHGGFSMPQRIVFLAILAITVAILAQPIFGQPSDAFQVRYAANLNIGDSFIDITNAGTSGGNICVNVYTFSPDEQLVSCCACSLTPNALESLSARQDLISNTLTPAIPTSIVVKLLASTGAGGCNAATPTTADLVPGMRAWGTTLHQNTASTDTQPSVARYDTTETPFSQASLSSSELTRITSTCGFIQSNGSGFGICRSCRLGGLGAKGR